MVVPSWHIAIMALAYAGEYFFRFLMRKDKKYISLGKAIGRMVLAMTYFYIYFMEPLEAERIILVRWSLFLFMGIDLFYIAQEHIMNRLFKHAN